MEPNDGRGVARCKGKCAVDSVQRRPLPELKVAPYEDLGNLHGDRGHRSLDVPEVRRFTGLEVSCGDPKLIHDPGELQLPATFLGLNLLGPRPVLLGGLLSNLLAGSLLALIPATLPAGRTSALLGVSHDCFQRRVHQTRINPEASDERAGAKVRKDTSGARLFSFDAPKNHGAAPLS